MDDINNKTKFNMSSLTLQRIHFSLYAAMNNYRQGKLKGWFEELRLIKMQFIFKLKPKEREELTDIEKEIMPLISKLNEVTSKLDSIQGSQSYADEEDKLIKGKSKNYLDARDKIEKYNEKIQDLMYIKGINLIDKDDETVFA